MKIVCTDKGNEASKELVQVFDQFSDSSTAYQFLENEFIKNLRGNGYLSASIDSIKTDRYLLTAFLFLGDRYSWGKFYWDEQFSKIGLLRMNKLLAAQEEILKPTSITNLSYAILDQLEEMGYPFANIHVDSSYWIDQQLYAHLKLEPGPLYHIDSIHVDTKMRINPDFLKRYLGFDNNQLYQKSLLSSVSKRIENLGYLKEFKSWDLSLYGTGSTLNLYLSSQKNNRFDFIAGLMPSNPLLKGKTQLTGEGNMELFNAFGNGEHLLLNWQQLQIQSPRLKVDFQRPFIFKTKLGLDLNFNLLKKDSSYLNLF